MFQMGSFCPSVSLRAGVRHRKSSSQAGHSGVEEKEEAQRKTGKGGEQRKTQSFRQLHIFPPLLNFFPSVFGCPQEPHRLLMLC